MQSAGSVRGVRFGGLLVRPQAAAEDGRTNTIPANHFVIVTSVVSPDDFAVDDPDDGVTVGTAAAGREAAADNRERDLHAASALVMVFVGVQLCPRIELLSLGGNAGSVLEGSGVHTKDELAALPRDLMARRTGANQKEDKRVRQN